MSRENHAFSLRFFYSYYILYSILPIIFSLRICTRSVDRVPFGHSLQRDCIRHRSVLYVQSVRNQPVLKFGPPRPSTSVSRPVFRRLLLPPPSAPPLRPLPPAPRILTVALVTSRAPRLHLWGRRARSRAARATPVTAAATSPVPARACNSSSSSSSITTTAITTIITRRTTRTTSTIITTTPPGSNPPPSCSRRTTTGIATYWHRCAAR